jgi:hypothetical protein
MPKRLLIVTAVACLALGALAPHWILGQDARPSRAVPDEGDKADLRLPKSALGVQRDWEYRQLWPCQPFVPHQPSVESDRLTGEAASALADMNALGKRGWELVSFVPVAGAVRDCYVATFKRPLLH